MHKISISEKNIYLDGKLLKGVQEYKLKNSPNAKLAELDIKMAVEVKDLAYFGYERKDGMNW